MNFVKDSCISVFFTLIEMEGDNLEASNVYAKLIKIHDEFKNNKNEKFQHVIDSCKSKLEKYLFQNGMPSIQLFKSLRILDPIYFKLNSVNFDEFTKDFPELKFCVDELNDYRLICSDLKDSIDSKEFWSINKNNLPKLYNLEKVFLHFPVSTSSVERSFSKYNNMLSSDRLRLKPESIKSLLFLYYNKNISQNETVSENEEDDEVLILQLPNETMSDIEELAEY